MFKDTITSRIERARTTKPLSVGLGVLSVLVLVVVILLGPGASMS